MTRARWIRSPLLGLLPLAAFAWVVVTKAREGTLPDLLWACNVSAVVIGVATLASWRWPLAVAFLFHASIGIPAWLLDVSATGTTYGASAACHLSTLLVGGLAVRRLGIPAGCTPAAFAYWIVLLLASWLFTPPERNVNLVHAPWEPLASTWGSAWVSHAANLCGLVLLLLAGEHVLRARLGWRSEQKRLRRSGPPASPPPG